VSEQVSKCCGAAVETCFGNVTTTAARTAWYVCTKCGNPCDVKPKEDVSGEHSR
jgi:hypothetical protein